MKRSVRNIIGHILCGVLIVGMFFSMEANAKVSQDELKEIMKNTNPRLTVTSYEVAEGRAVQGESFTLKVNAKNTNQYADAMNVLVTYTVNTSGVAHLMDGIANQYYVEYVGAGEEFSFEVPMEALDGYNAENFVMTFSFSYYDKNSIAYESSSMISPQISKNCEMKINSINVAEKAMVGANSLINILYSSVGNLPIESASMIIEGDIVGSGKTVVLEGVSDNEQKNIDYYLEFKNAGEQIISISFKYQDEDGNEYVVEPREFEVTVSPYQEQITNVSQEGTITLVTEDNEIFYLIGSIAIIVAVVAVVALFIVKEYKK